MIAAAANADGLPIGRRLAVMISSLLQHLPVGCLHGIAGIVSERRHWPEAGTWSGRTVGVLQHGPL